MVTLWTVRAFCEDYCWDWVRKIFKRPPYFFANSATDEKQIYPW